jgi:hypothetical protein
MDGVTLWAKILLRQKARQLNTIEKIIKSLLLPVDVW